MLRQGTPPFSVLQLEDKKDNIVVVGIINLGKDMQKMLSTMQNKERQTFLWNLRKDLLLANCGFQFSPNLTSFTSIQVNKPIYYDSLSKNKLFEIVQSIVNMLLLIIWSLQQALGISPDKQKDSSTPIV